MNLTRALFHTVLACLLFLTACNEGKKSETGDSHTSHKLNIVTTTGLLEDAVKNITGDKAEVTALMGPGVDPHLYKATQGDLEKLNKADIIIYNGLHLEGKMAEILHKVSKKRKVVAASDGLDKTTLRAPEGYNNAYDPHIWFNVKLWSQAVKYVGEQLSQADQANSELYKKNTEAYLSKLDSLDKWVREEISTIPEDRRVLITAHDAFGYFGDAYHIEVKGLQGISTVSDFGLGDIKRLVDLIVAKKIKAVFVESSVPQKNIEAVVEGCQSRGHEVKIGGTLYSDALGAAGTPEGTYAGMVKSNVETMVNALR